MPAQFAILAPDGTGSLKAADRKHIRSYCMKGRNARADSRRSLRRARQKRLRGQSSESDENLDHERGTPSPIRSKTLVKTEDFQLHMPWAHSQADDFRLLGFSDTVDPSNGELIFKYFTYDKIKTMMHPLTHCVAFTQDAQLTLQWLLEDPAFLHSVLLTTSAVDDHIHKRIPSRLTRLYTQSSLSLLNKQLDRKDAYLSRSLFYVVISLAFVAGVLGDHDAAAAHMEGIWRIVRLRGGIDPRTHVKMLQMDLWISLIAENSSIRARSSVEWKPLLRAPPRIIRTGVDTFIEKLGLPRLTSLFYDLQDLAGRINYACSDGSLIEEISFDASVKSIQGRLLHLPTPAKPSANALRLGMLTFMTTMFRIPGERVPLERFSTEFKAACLALNSPTHEMQQLIFWLLMVGNVSVLDAADDETMLERWKEVNQSGTSWVEAKTKLGEVMWIDCLHDELGHKAFARLTTKTRGSP